MFTGEKRYKLWLSFVLVLSSLSLSSNQLIRGQQLGETSEKNLWLLTVTDSLKYNIYYRGRQTLNIVSEIHKKKLKTDHKDEKAKTHSGSTYLNYTNIKARPPDIE